MENVRFGVLVAKTSASVTERHEKIKRQFYTYNILILEYNVVVEP
jgi:hypothetical protein